MANVAALPILLKELHLGAMARPWEVLQEEALANHWTLAHYLTVLCENEVAHRHTQRLQRYRKESHLPAAKTLTQFDFGACPQANSTQLAHLAHNADWVERADNLLLFGPSGVGKTHLAAAIGHGLIE
jgi:DNA replication protein DnaC